MDATVLGLYVASQVLTVGGLVGGTVDVVSRVSAYRDQLAAGYTKITPEFGLRVFMRDFNKLSKEKRTKKAARGPPS